MSSPRIIFCLIAAILIANPLNARIVRRFCQLAVINLPYLQRHLYNPRPIEVRDQDFQTLDDLYIAFSQGMIPDLRDSDQKRAFLAYLDSRFGVRRERDPKHSDLVRIQSILKAHPELERKIRFADVDASFQKRKMLPVDGEMKSLGSRMIRSSKENAGRLLNIEANIGTHKKIFQVISDSSDEALSYIRSFFSKSDWAILSDKSESLEKRSTILFHALTKVREKLLLEKKDIRFVDQALVDLVSASAVLADSALADGLTKGNSLQRIQSMILVKQRLDSVADNWGYKDHFEEVLRVHNSIGATGVARPNELEDFIFRFQNKSRSQSQEEGEAESFRLRDLSVYEAPLRSCLGGSDCSSDTYFDRALDPSYHYFTAMNSEGVSSGQMTVVLGKNNEAFLDKVQNIPDPMLVPMLDALALSLDQKGYRLMLPVDVGGAHTGLSNDSFTRLSMSSLTSELRNKAKSPQHIFQTNRDVYHFYKGYTVAPNKPEVIEYPKKDSSPHFVLHSPQAPWRPSSLDFVPIAKRTVELRNGTQEDQIKYIKVSPAILDLGLVSQDEHRSLLTRWFLDSKTTLQLKSDLFIQLYKNMSNNDFLSLLKKIPVEDRAHYLDLVCADEVLRKDPLVFRILTNDNINLIMPYIHKVSLSALRTFLDSFASRELSIPVVRELLKNVPDSMKKMHWDAYEVAKSFDSVWKEQAASKEISPQDKADFIRELYRHDPKETNIYELVNMIDYDQRSQVTIILFKDQGMKESYDLNRPVYFCFVSNTPILTKYSRKKPIQKIREGDWVRSYDFQSQQVTFDRVIKLKKSKSTELLKFVFTNNKVLMNTPEHPYYSLDRDLFVRAKDLKTGERLIHLRGTEVENVEIRSIEVLNKREVVYNFETEKYHNYFANGVLVHNIK